MSSAAVVIGAVRVYTESSKIFKQQHFSDDTASL